MSKKIILIIIFSIITLNVWAQTIYSNKYKTEDSCGGNTIWIYWQKDSITNIEVAEYGGGCDDYKMHVKEINWNKEMRKLNAVVRYFDSLTLIMLDVTITMTVWLAFVGIRLLEVSHVL